MRVLVARWATDGNATLQPPALLWWNDGTPATLDHYKDHLNDTHSWVIMPPTGIERRTFPDIVADVKYSEAVTSWVIDGEGVPSASLELPDRNATDDQILAELYAFPIVYRARIHR